MVKLSLNSFLKFSVKVSQESYIETIWRVGNMEKFGLNN